MKYPKLPVGYSVYGSQMGRSDAIEEPDEAIKFHLYKLHMSGDYDSEGAYWGMGRNSESMWHAYGDGPKFRNEMFVRARDRNKAKLQVLAEFRNSKFFR